MDKWQALYSFWNGFGCEAYEQNSVPDRDDIEFPYITYPAASGLFDSGTSVMASVWTRSTSWELADSISDAVEHALSHGGKTVRYDGGLIWITAGQPFSQSMGDPSDDKVKRKVLTVYYAFL